MSDNKKPLTEAELENIVQRMFEEDKSNDENVESDSEFSEENIGTNDFDSLSEQSISDEINEQNKKTKKALFMKIFILEKTRQPNGLN